MKTLSKYILNKIVKKNSIKALYWFKLEKNMMNKGIKENLSEFSDKRNFKKIKNHINEKLRKCVHDEEK